MTKNLASMLVCLAALRILPVAAGADLPKCATVLDADIVWDPVDINSAAISPDGSMIAYISKGAIWKCAVTAGTPKKLVDLPNTITAFLVQLDFAAAREKFGYAAANAGYEPIPQLRGQVLQTFGLQWTSDQDGVIYTTRRRLKPNSTRSAYEMKHVSLDGTVSDFADLEGDFTITPDSNTTFSVTRDRKHVIVSSFGAPLIWDVATNKPQATNFDYLLPSSTSGRLLGVEIDTREFVLVDANFHIAKRFGVVLDQRRRCDLFWSPDEKTAICRSYVEFPSNKWEGFRVDLPTGTIRKLDGGIRTDRFLFNGRGNEAVRIGRMDAPQGGYADGSNGTFIELIPDGDEPVRDIVRFTRRPLPTDNYRDHRWYPAVIGSSDCTLFAIALPRDADKRRGYHFHLVARDGTKWPLDPVDVSHYYTPCLPIGFANHDQTIVARTPTQLISISVQSILANGNVAR